MSLDAIYAVGALLVGAGIWAVLVYKARGLVPFAKQNMADRRTLIETQLTASREATTRLAEVQKQVEGQIQAAHDQADEILARAHTEAIAEAEDVRRRGQDDCAALLARAREDISAERDRAISDLRRETSAVVVDAAGRVLSQSLDRDGQRALVERSLDQLPQDRGGAN